MFSKIPALSRRIEQMSNAVNEETVKIRQEFMLDSTFRAKWSCKMIRTKNQVNKRQKIAQSETNEQES